MSASAIPTTSPAQAGTVTAEADFPLGERAFRTACVAIALLLPALICLCVAYVAEPDIWWHLSSGEWILAHGAFPRVDIFSSTTLGQPWQAYSWLFEVLLDKLYGHFGLAGVVGYSSAMALLITAAFFYLVQSTQRSLRVALPLTLAGSLALLTLFSPRPWHFTIWFFVLELALIQSARRTGKITRLALLPLMFALWANLHIQFIDGLLLLLLVVADSFVAKKSDADATRISRATALSVLAACVAATLINPYGWRIYAVAHDLASQPGVVNGIEELKAMPFRAPSNYLVLFLTLAAASTLAYKRRFRFFDTSLLIGAAMLSFRSQRDVWIVTVVAISILSRHFGGDVSEETEPVRIPQLLPSSVFAALLLFGAAHLIKLSDATLQPKLEAAMPVRAAAFVRDNRIAGPVFCDFIWGGYLIHSLDLPVSIDGRAALHGDEQIQLSARTWSGAPDWSSNPQLASAGVVVAPVSAALTQLLRSDPRFDRVYEDGLAAVFVPHKQTAVVSLSLH